MRRRLRAKAADFERAGRASIYQLGNNVMADSVERTPLDLGPLRASAYVTIPESGKNPVSEIGYGGPSAPYAVIQHEHEFNHEVGESHFLLNALNAARPTAERDLAALMRHNLGRGGEPGGGGFPTSPQGSGAPADRAKAAKAKRAAAKKWERRKGNKPRRRGRR